MELFGKLLVRMRLYAEGFVDGQHLEKKRKLSTISFANFRGHQSQIILDEIKERSLSREIPGGKGGVCAHP